MRIDNEITIVKAVSMGDLITAKLAMGMTPEDQYGLKFPTECLELNTL